MKINKNLVLILALSMTLSGSLTTRALADGDSVETGATQELNINDTDKEDLTLEKLTSIDRELRETRVFKIATDSEIKSYEDALAALKSALEQGSDVNLAELMASLEKAKGDLGYTTYKGLTLRTKLRKDLVHLSKLEVSEDLTRLKDDTEKALSNHNTSVDDQKSDNEVDPTGEDDQVKEREEFDKASKGLAKKIDEATSDKISKDSLDKLKLDYKDKLNDLLVAEGVKLEDIKNLEKEFDLKLNPKVNANMSQTEVSDSKKDGKDQAEKRVDKKQESNKENKNKTIQKKKLVKVDKKKDNNTEDTKVKKDKGQSKDVKTGVTSLLPIVGTVAVVAIVALIFLSRKNKNK